MKVKKYNATTMAEAMNQIKIELGHDAVILNSKVLFTGGFMGFFKKKSFEVIAAIDPETIGPQYKEKPRKVERVIEPNDFPVVKREEHRKEQSQVLHEISELKRIVKKLNMKNGGIILHEYIQTIVETLRSQDLAQEYIDDIILLLTEIMKEKESTLEELQSVAQKHLLQKIPTETASLFQKKYVNVVGPTGVGKTTTIAKLAAEMALKHFKKVAFITTDTYRIAAIDQLKTYAKILNVPIEVAYNTEDFQKAIEKFSHYDIVFIDTAGRNFRNKEYVEDLQKMISFDEEMETYLVLSLTSKQRDMEEILRQFSLIPISSFIFTKMDETASFGAVYNMMASFQMNTAYITNGQNVPDDIVKMSSSTIVQTILEGTNDERSS